MNQSGIINPFPSFVKTINVKPQKIYKKRLVSPDVSCYEIEMATLQLLYN